MKTPPPPIRRRILTALDVHCLKFLLRQGRVLLAGWLLVAPVLVAPVLGAPNTNLWVFLCFGQSNMEGFPGVETRDQVGVDRRFQLLAAVDFPGLQRTEGNWYPATPPLCRPGTGISPADYFGRTLVSNLPPQIRVGVINIAISDCRLDLFLPQAGPADVAASPPWMRSIISNYHGNLFAHLVTMGRRAQRDGVIKGVLVHHGEANLGDAAWPAKVKTIYDRLLAELQLNPTDAPLLAGEVVGTDQNGVAAAMNRIIDRLPESIPTAHVISSAGCGCRIDRLHFTPAGYRELGTRYGLKMLSLWGRSPASASGQSAPTAPR